MKRKNNKRAFTLIELLVTVLIIAILMAIALPLYLSTIKDSERKTCRANMQTIATAVQAYRVRYRLNDYADIIAGGVDVLKLDLGSTVLCPVYGNAGGVYVVEQGHTNDNDTYKIGCTTDGTTTSEHETFEPGVDTD